MNLCQSQALKHQIKPSFLKNPLQGSLNNNPEPNTQTLNTTPRAVNPPLKQALYNLGRTSLDPCKEPLKRAIPKPLNAEPRQNPLRHPLKDMGPLVGTLEEPFKGAP